LAELATAISAAAGKQVTYTDLPADKLARVLTGAGLPAELADVLADADLGLSRGEMFTDAGDLRRLLGRPTTTLADAVAGALR
jgi:NAD(P)H dehydrogenase (quinone)